MSVIFSDCFANVNSGSSTKLKVKHWSANEKKWQSRTLALWQRTLTHSHKRTQPLHRRGRTNEPKHLCGKSTRWRSNPRLKTERIERSQRKIPKIVLRCAEHTERPMVRVEQKAAKMPAKMLGDASKWARPSSALHHNHTQKSILRKKMSKV